MENKTKNNKSHGPRKKTKGLLNQVAKNSLKKSLEKRKKERQNLFTFNSLVTKFAEVIKNFPDKRTGTNTSVTLRDAALAAFALFFLQSPSFLDYQTTMQKTKGQNNAESLFGVYQIHSDNHIRDLLDSVHPSLLSPMFSFIINGLQKSNYLDDFLFYGRLLVALDATQFFSSNIIHCVNCNQRQHENDSITYYHSAVLPVIVKPENNKVIALQPEYITPQDGHHKQDCEIAAAKRWVRANAERLRDMETIMLLDDLYCKQPFCKLLLEEGLDFIMVCKKESHQTLYEYLQFQEEDIQVIKKERWQGKRCYIDTYRFFNDLPLRDGDDALEVNWCELTITVKDSNKVTYKNAFATNLEITQKNVKMLIAAGRARWKVENENHNVLKNRGYHLEHNFGHGKKNLSTLLVSFNILAFLIHTVLELMDQRYQLIRTTLPSRKTFFDHMRTLTCYLYFGSWEDLMIFMMEKLKLNEPGANR